MATNYHEDGHTVDWYNDTGAEVLSGQPVTLGSIVGVAHDDIPPETTGVLHTTGVFILDKKDAEAVTQGQTLFLSDGLLTGTPAAGGSEPVKGKTAASTPRAGTAWASAEASEPRVPVRLGF